MNKLKYILGLLLIGAHHASAGVVTTDLKNAVLSPPTKPGQTSRSSIALPGGSVLNFLCINDGFAGVRAVSVAGSDGNVKVGVGGSISLGTFVQPLKAGETITTPATTKLASSANIHSVVMLSGYWTPVGNFKGVTDKRYMAFQFQNASTGNQLRYGWLELSVKTSTAPLGYPVVTLHRMAYEDSGKLIYMGGDAVAAVAPTIAAPPASQVVAAGASASFEISAAGTGPLAYQWLFNGSALNDGAGVTGSRTAKLTLSNVQAIRAGNYSVKVSNSVGSVTSTAASLTLLAKPAITSQPLNQTVTAGATASFAISASGNGTLTYQWSFNGKALSDGAGVTGSRTAKLTISNVQGNRAGNYSVTVGNAAGSVTSAAASLTLLAKPAITSQPLNQTVTTGGSASFAVSANGSGTLSYQWLFNGKALSEGAGVAGSRTAKLTLSNVQANRAGNYSVSVSNSVGSVTSSAASLTVKRK